MNWSEFPKSTFYEQEPIRKVNDMVMCQHSQDYETCRFGCTLRKKEELRVENDQLKERIQELEADQCPSWMGKDKGCNETSEKVL